MAELKTLAPNNNLPGQVPNLSPGINPLEKKLDPKDQKSTADEKKPATNLNKKSNSLQDFTGNFVSIGELFAAAPLVFSSFINQAENISKYGKKVEANNTLSFYAYVVENLSFIPRKLLDRLINRKGEEDVSGNERASVFQDFYKRILHPNLSKEFTSLLFTFRRVIFNFFPDTFTVPSDESDPGEAKTKRTASSSAKIFLEALSRSHSPFRIVTSLVAGLTMIPSNLFGVITAYTGNQKLYDISKEFSKLNDIYTPIVSNLSSLYSSTKAFIDSYSKPGKESLSVSFGRYNISYLHVAQGLIGSLLSIPYFFGILAKTKEIILKTDDGVLENDGSSRFSFVSYVRDIVAETAPQIKSLGFFQNDSVVAIQDKVGNFVRKSIEGINKYPHQVLEAFFNSSKLTKDIFSKIRPLNHAGRVQALIGPDAFESENAKENYFLGMNKKIFFKEVFEFLHPIQSLLMLLPNAFVTLNDPYVADNANKYMRGFDRLIGFNSIIFSVPNYLVYALSTRVPQLIMKYHQWQFRRAELKGERYDPIASFARTVNLIKRLPLFGFNTYLSGRLEKLMENFNEFTFKDEDEMSNELSKLEEEARSQEASVKASELVGAMRIGFRTLLGLGWFYAKRDDKTGWTDEEANSMKIYNSLGTFKEGVNKFPVVGWIAGPFIEMFRKLYYVPLKTDRKKLQISTANTPTINKETNPLAALQAAMAA